VQRLPGRPQEGWGQSLSVSDTLALLISRFFVSVNTTFSLKFKWQIWLEPEPREITTDKLKQELKNPKPRGNEMTLQQMDII
jgi:hypothetical protein